MKREMTRRKRGKGSSAQVTCADPTYASFLRNRCAPESITLIENSINKDIYFNIFIYSLYETLFVQRICFIEEHYMFRHISAIIRCWQFSILTLNILKSYAQRSPNTFTLYICCNNDKLIKMTNLLKKLPWNLLNEYIILLVYNIKIVWFLLSGLACVLHTVLVTDGKPDNKNHTILMF
jgi:hypothetical protein